MIDEPISSSLNGAQFSYYTADEIRQLSVKQITNPMAYDQLNRPIKGGICDPALGASVIDKRSSC